MRTNERTIFLVRSPISLRIGVGLLFLLPAAISFSVLAVELARGAGVVVPLLITGIGCLILTLASLLSAAFVKVSESHVTIGFFPVWMTRISRESIRDISTETIDSYRDYNGWGIKGLAKQASGRFYSAGGNNAVRIHDTQGRTFLVAFPHGSQAPSLLKETLQPPGTKS